MKKFIKTVLDNTPVVKNIYRTIKNQEAFPAGHYYSPIPDKEEMLEYYRSKNQVNLELPDVKINKEGQFNLLKSYVQYYKELPFPETQSINYRYYYNNGWYNYADAIFLYCFLRLHAPKRIIEIGSGFSSAVILDTVDHSLSYSPEITFVEPDPRRLRSLLRYEDEMRITIIDKKIQKAPFELFSALEEGDFLLIDSSHVVKCGNDVQLLMFDLLPVLSPGVYVHFHDVFYPFEYPFEWLRSGRYWNEAYFLRAFLSYNCEWNICFFNSYIAFAFKEFVEVNMPLCTKDTGGSLYIQRQRKVI